MMIFKSLIIISSLLSLSHSISFRCEKFISSTWWKDATYECQNSNLYIDSKTNREITAATGYHNYRKSNSDVESLWIHDTKVNYFPQGFDKYYPNLIAISLTTVQLKEVSCEDLKPFPKLIKIYLTNNLLEILDGDLFKYNTNLERLSFDGNRIRHVGGSLFVGHQNLKYLHFTNNRCYNGKAENDRFDVMMLALNIQTDCFDVKYEAELLLANKTTEIL